MRGKCLPLILLLGVTACAARGRTGPGPAMASGGGPVLADATVDPNADRDNDGFLDLQDTCPGEPGHEPDGCPVRDSDRDQIFDVDDDCPDAPEAVNRFRDHDGCPDEFPARWAILDQPVFFGVTVEELRERPMDELTPAIKAGLEQIADLMREYPELRIEMIGHHDGAWKLRGKQNPSARRVLAARKFLVEKQKIKTKRVHFRTAGSDEPIADNDAPDGPLKNNRLEFRILSN